MLCMDPHYRSLRGLLLLIQKAWEVKSMVDGVSAKHEAIHLVGFNGIHGKSELRWFTRLI